MGSVQRPAAASTSVRSDRAEWYHGRHSADQTSGSLLPL